MLERLSHLFVRTLREDPADAEVASHKWLVRAGYIRPPGARDFCLVAPGASGTTQNRRHHPRGDAKRRCPAGALSLLCFPREPYEATGRWDEYGDNIFRLKDRKDADYLLAPTHEEVFTLTVKDLYSSYKDLPLTIYQIQDKYRDEGSSASGPAAGPRVFDERRLLV